MKYISSALTVIFTIISLFSPIFVVLGVIEILGHFSLSLGDWTMYTDMIRVPNYYESLSFAPAQYVISLEWVQGMIVSSGYPRFMGFLVPIIVDGVILMISVSILYSLFLIFFGSIGVFLICLRSLPSMLFHLFVKAVRVLGSIAFGNNPFRAFWIWITIYTTFLYSYTKDLNPLRIIKTHVTFLSYILPFRRVPTFGRLYQIFKVGFESRSILESLNTILSRIFKDDHIYAGNYNKNKDGISFFIYRGESGKTLGELKKVIEHQEDFCQAFHLQKGKISIKNHDDGLEVMIQENFKWSTRKITMPALLELLRGRKWSEVVVGFLQDGSPYYMDILDMGMMAIIGLTQVGKDVILRIIEASLAIQGLLAISRQESEKLVPKILVWYADVKNVDGFWMENIPGFTRISNRGDAIACKLEELVIEMDKRSERYEKFVSISGWNKAYPNNPDPYIIFVVNEINDVLASSESGVRSRILASLKSVMSKGLSLGLRIFYLGQSIRRDGSSEMGSLLVNISTRAVGYLGNIQEQRIALGNHYETYSDLERYNFVFIRDGRVEGDIIRPYLTDPLEIRSWAKESFSNSSLGEEDSTIFSDNIEPLSRENEDKRKVPLPRAYAYLDKVNIPALITEAYKIKSFPRKLARDFGIPEKAFPFFMLKLSEIGIVKIREGMTAEVQEYILLEEAILRVQSLLQSNQD